MPRRLTEGRRDDRLPHPLGPYGAARTWARFRAHIQSQGTTGDRPVSRLAGMSPGQYASMADVLLTDLRRNAPGTLARLRASVPRHTDATDTSTAELGDARLIIAGELGLPTWRELMSFAEKSVRDVERRGETWRRLRPQAEALLAGDTDRLAGLTAEQADTLLHMLAYPRRSPAPGSARSSACRAPQSMS